MSADSGEKKKARVNKQQQEQKIMQVVSIDVLHDTEWWASGKGFFFKLSINVETREKSSSNSKLKWIDSKIFDEYVQSYLNF